jgi:hypothetical protein
MFTHTCGHAHTQVHFPSIHLEKNTETSHSSFDFIEIVYDLCLFESVTPSPTLTNFSSITFDMFIYLINSSADFHPFFLFQGCPYLTCILDTLFRQRMLVSGCPFLFSPSLMLFCWDIFIVHGDLW